MASVVLEKANKVQPIKVKELIKEYGEELPPGLKIPGAITSAKVYIGEDEDGNIFEGSNGKDVMVAMGANNTFTTGKSGQTVIVSEANESDDKYTVNSFTAGTVIVDGGGNDTLAIKGVNTNDIHMAAIGIDNEKSMGASVAFLTDTKGVKNLAGINIPQIYNKYNEVMEAMNDPEMSEAGKVKVLNSALKMIPGLINKVRGVGIYADNSYDWDYETDTEIETTSNIFENITVVDKKGNEQTISRDDMATYQEIMMDKVIRYIDYASEVLNDKGLMPEGGILEYLVTEPAKADKKLYKQLTSGFFDMFKNMYIGTSGDNSYTIKKSDSGVAIVSGTGSDKFVFKGDIGSDVGIDYNIVSNIGDGDVDYIELKKYSLAKETLYADGWIEHDDDNVYFKGMDFEALNTKKNTYADIEYIMGGEGYDITENKFAGLTIKDADTTYNVTAEYSPESVNYDWTTANEAKKSHFAIIDAYESSIKSNAANNIIQVGWHEDDYSSFEYTYGGGKDTITSSGDYSDDTYTVGKFDKNTKLNVYDYGMYDEDTLVIGNGDKNTKLFFNVDQEGNASDIFSAIAAENMNKKNFSVFGEGVAVIANNGINFTVNMDELGYDGSESGIEYLYYGDNEIELDEVVAAITEEVTSWLTTNNKGYADVADVLMNGSKSEINQVLAIYNNFDVATCYNSVI